VVVCYCFNLDCSSQADSSGNLVIGNLNIQNNVLAGQKLYVQFANLNLNKLSNGIEVTFLA